MHKVFYRYFKKFLPDNRGIALPLVGIMGFLLIGFGGVVADYGRAQVAQSRMQASLDAGTLAAAKHIPDPPVAVVEVRKYFDTNYNDFMNTIILDFQANVNGNTLNTSAEGQINTWIMQIFGMRTLDFTANSSVELNVTDTEIVFVLDNTGSMNAENMPVLKTSMTRFLNRFYDDPLMAANLYIGLVPFSNSVNISPARAGWTEPDNYLWGSAAWDGCIIARYPNNRDITDDPPNMQRFLKYYWPCFDDGDHFVAPGDGDYNPNLWHGTDAAAQNCEATGTVNFAPLLNVDLGPLKGCETLHPVVPMTGQKDILLNAVNALQGVGSTQITTGLAWGWNMLSPRWRGLWGGEMNANNLPKNYDLQKTAKHMILISDGANLLFTAYSAYGKLSDGNLGTTDRPEATNEVNRRTLELCNRIKANNIRLYTIALGRDITPATLDLLRQCATSPADFFDSPANSRVLTGILLEVQKNVTGSAVSIRLIR